MPRPTKNLLNMRFGKLTVLKKCEGRGATRWECLCDCGKTKTVSALHLLSNRINSCGCLKREKNTGKHQKLIGQKINNLLVLCFADRRGSRMTIHYNCLCDCGKNIVVSKTELLSGKTKSCGCLFKKRKTEKANESLKRVGKITILGLSEKVGNRNARKWNCVCDCGAHLTINEGLLRKSVRENKILSCGCSRGKPINMPKELLFLGKHLHGTSGYGHGCRCEICKKKTGEYYKRKRESNPNIKILGNLRKSFYKALKNQKVKKVDHVVSLISCDIPFLLRHLEKQFQTGMNWKNYGKVWHIDHIIPCACFDFTQKIERWQCFHFNNLRPCFSRENISKNSFYNGVKYYHKRNSQNESL